MCEWTDGEWPVAGSFAPESKKKKDWSKSEEIKEAGADKALCSDIRKYQCLW